METFPFRAMNTDILLAGEGTSDRLAEGFERTREFIQASERRFTRFSTESELSELNRSAGTWFKASPDMFKVIALSWRFFHKTRGLFDPSILPDLRRAGYSLSMDLLRERGATPLFESILADKRLSFSEIELDEARQSIFLPEGMSLDLGGIAKGWIAEQSAGILSGFASTCAVNAGGDMFLVGLPDGEAQWEVALENPLQPDQNLSTLRVQPGAVATSAVTKRVWDQDGKSRHHLIDPRTGESAITDWLSVTIIAAHTYEAEVFAKTLLIAGPQEAETIARTSGTRFSYLAVDRYQKIWGTQQSLEFIYDNATLTAV